MKQLDGRHALITGGTQGIGGEIAVAIAKAGGDVLLIGLRDDNQAQLTLNRCRDQGVKADLICCDLSRPPVEYTGKLVEQITSAMPDVDLLVNNAGTYLDVPFFEMDFERYIKTMHLNVSAGYFLTQAIAKRWVEGKIAGRVVFTGSINGLLSEADHTAYDTSKGAVAAMVRSLCVSLAPHGIRVNAMAPGLVRTPLTGGAIDEGNMRHWMELHTPNGKVPPADACAGTVVFLLSDAADHIHGQTIYVDGGMSAWQQPPAPKSF
ncbi:SDR family NAD(P)-dependent oxidoreductase [Rhodopirellula sp. MGV]|uniref:SDR family NAD(P)-dependent oxidoreductase n=1 Tax=Rhodopirellula sp. MGV TaxID=2023130 RepID=UPI000B963890|nr:SDR family oxidoreductase [Rhodopirellula sp. MGV]OYP29477.1 oxidoreductase [Rhodopirellula sp. MGV]PNY35771.1 SDR family NAD(P)-dependent oxidoreductase [Rhodopirellula baltica]